MPLVVPAEEDLEPVFFPSAMFGMAAKLEHTHLQDIRPLNTLELWVRVCELLSEWKCKRLGIESRCLSQYHVESVKMRLSNLSLVDVTDIVECLRMVKTADELDNLRKASDITNSTAKAVVDYLRPGETEMDVARRIIQLVAEFGGEDVSFHPQVFSGRRGYLLNISSSETKRLEKGEIVLLDYGAVYRGYRTDITRAYVLGPPSSKHIEVSKKVVKIVQDTVNYVRPGLKASDIHAFALQKFREVGYGDYCKHYTGHGLGLALEKPILIESDNTQIRENMVLAIEQGIYFPDFGIRYEDNIIVGRDQVENMNSIPLELVQIG